MTQKSSQSEAYPLTFIGGALLGFVLGSVLALWYAPQSGKKTFAIFRGRLQGETIEQSLEEGRALAHRHRAQQADRLTEEATHAGARNLLH